MFIIEMHYRDYNLLLLVQNYLNCGSIIYSKTKNTYTFGVYSGKDLENYIIPHFNKFPLRGVKYLDYIDFKEIINIKKRFLPIDQKFLLINKIKSNMNSNREIVNCMYQPEHAIKSNENYIPLNPNYISGFFEGDGSFIVDLSGSRIGRITFSIDQNERDRLLLESFKLILNLKNNLILNKRTGVMKLQKSRDKYFKLFLIPFFLQYPIYGNKFIQLEKILEILKLKGSLPVWGKKISNEHQLILTNIWQNNNHNISGQPDLQLLKDKFKSLTSFKQSYNSKKIMVIDTKNSNKSIEFETIISTCKTLSTSNYKEILR